MPDLIKSNRMDRRITIESFTTTTNSFNEQVKSWSAFATVWAEFKPRRMSEAFEAARTVATRQAMFTIRWLSGLNETMRIVFDDGAGSKNWDIVSLDQIGRREGWRIIAEVES